MLFTVPLEISSAVSDFVYLQGLPNKYEFTSGQMDVDDEEDEDGHLSSAVSTVSDISVTQTALQDLKQEMQDVDFFDPTEDEQAVLGNALPSGRALTTKRYRNCFSFFFFRTVRARVSSVRDE